MHFATAEGGWQHEAAIAAAAPAKSGARPHAVQRSLFHSAASPADHWRDEHSAYKYFSLSHSLARSFSGRLEIFIKHAPVLVYFSAALTF
jgi:hypothetical protein